MSNIDLFRNEPDIRTYAAGQLIFSEGEPGEFMFAVIAGEVKIEKQGKVIRTIQQGEVFGEMALIDGQPRSASAIAVSECKVAAVTEKRFMLVVKTNPFFAIEMLRILTERLRQQTES